MIKYGVIETSYEDGFCDKEFKYFDKLEDAIAEAEIIASNNNLTESEKENQYIEIDEFETYNSDNEEDYLYINSCKEIKYK